MAVLVIAFAVVWSTPVITVRSIEVAGTQHAAAEELVAASGVKEGDNLLRVDRKQIGLNVLQQPWLRKAEVSVHLPGTVSIEVEERQAMLFARQADGTHLIDDQGEAFLVADPPEGTIEVAGHGVDDPVVLSHAIDVARAIPADKRGAIQVITIDSGEDIVLQLHDGRTVAWGADDNNHDKARAFAIVLDREGKHWNISNPTAVTVRP